MIRKEQEKLGKEIVEKLNKREKIKGIEIYNFYNINIKQFHYIKIEEIDPNNFNLIVLPEDSDGESLLDIKFDVELYSQNNFTYQLYFELKNSYYHKNKFNFFTKFRLTGNYWEVDYLDYWLISRDKRFKWIIEKLKKDNPEYNLAMYELYGFNEEYVRKELNYERRKLY